MVKKKEASSTITKVSVTKEVPFWRKVAKEAKYNIYISFFFFFVLKPCGFNPEDNNQIYSHDNLSGTPTYKVGKKKKKKKKRVQWFREHI